jgi:DNA-binding XRE family transcriptional regulator
MKEGWMKPRIRVFRKQQGMTQQALADAVGCRRSALSEWETGTRCVPQWHLWKLARCLHVTVDELYDVDEADEAPTPEAHSHV